MYIDVYTHIVEIRRNETGIGARICNCKPGFLPPASLGFLQLQALPYIC